MQAPNRAQLAPARTINRKRSATNDDKAAKTKRRPHGTANSPIFENTNRHYVFMGIIDRGSFGVVTKVRRRGDPTKTYADKHLPLGKVDLENIRKEVRLIRQVQHQHIVQVVDSFVDSTREWYHIILEPDADSDLAKYLRNIVSHREREKFGQQRLTLLRWMSCLAAALYYIHSVQIRHRDIKPENILVHGDNILFTDFGTSYHSEQDTRYTGTETPGTVKYMPPEASNKQRFGRRGDIFSLGCVFWEMTEAISGLMLVPKLPEIGSHSYASANASERLLRDYDKMGENSKLKDKLPSEFHFSDDFPRPLLLLIAEMLNPKPLARPTADEVVDYFNQILIGSDCLPAPCCSLQYKREVDLEPRQRDVIRAITGPDKSTQLLVLLDPVSAVSILVALAATIQGTGTTIVVVPTAVPRADMLQRMEDCKVHYLLWTPKEKRAAPIVFMSAEAVCTDDFVKYTGRLNSLQKLDRIVVNDCDETTSVGHCMLGAQVIQGQTQTVWLRTTLSHRDEASFNNSCFLAGPDVIRHTTDRPNIRYSIQLCENSKGLRDSAESLLQAWIAAIHTPDEARVTIENHPTRKRDSARAIVYCERSDDLHELADRLGCPRYPENRGYLGCHMRDMAIKQWLASTGSPVIVVPYSARFSLDYPHVRLVLHVGDPVQFNHYVEGSGHAGRDGKVAESIVLITSRDLLPSGDRPWTKLDMRDIGAYFGRGACLRYSISSCLGDTHMASCEPVKQQLCSLCMPSTSDPGTSSAS